MSQSLPSLSSALGSFILQIQSTALQRHSTFRVAIPAAPSPPFWLLPRTLSSATQTPAADERAVPLTHTDSNFGLLKSTLLESIPPDHPHGKPAVAKADTQAVANHYEQTLISCFAAKDSVKHPIFDLILLGCGSDGHTCSLFPNHPVLRETVAWVAAVEDSPKPPPKRITLTLPVLAHANKIVFVATGKGKREVLKAVFEQPEDGLPCSLVNVQAGGDKVVWFVDEEAIEEAPTLLDGGSYM
ncbi:hypothetical protein BDZ91DRAFT_771589 [Kalaharituber pfeilii]|nr:hypothetical protein BDZ91DRAFT_771589 [Kalaharituber pfeilii]